LEAILARRLHFFRRRGVYCWRRRLPLTLAQAFGTTHVSRSLRTADFNRARFRALRLSAGFDRRLQDLERQMDDGKTISRWHLDDLLAELYDQVIQECEAWAASAPDVLFDGSDPDANSDAEDDALVEYVAASPDSRRDHWEAALAQHDHRLAAARLMEIADRNGLDMQSDGPAFRQMARQGMKVGVVAFSRYAERAGDPAVLEHEVDQILSIRDMLKRPIPMDPGSYNALRDGRDAPQVPAVASHHGGPPSQPPRPPEQAEMPVGRGALHTLGEAVDRRMQAKIGQGWQGKTARDAHTSARLLLEYFGPATPIDTIAKKAAREYRTDLGKLPNMHGKGRFRGLSMQDAASEADAFDEEIASGGVPDAELQGKGFRAGRVARMSLKTAKKHLSFAKGVFDQAMEDDARLQSNPFAGLQYSNSEIEKHGGGERQHWRDEDVRRLLGSPVWSGCLSEKRRDTPGSLVIKDGRYWIPLLALYAGLRLEEACQLHADDVREIEGITCICVEPGVGKTVKSRASRRQIPVHSELVKRGFLDHVAAHRGGRHARLFPELERGGPHSLLGYQFSKWFTAYRRSAAVDLYEPWMDFHSLRKTFSTHILRKKKVDTLVSVLLGHKLQGVTNQHYFGGFSAGDMVDTVELIDFGRDHG
jgi:integrase